MAKKMALCIGINNYPGTDNDLSGCVNDANDWAAVLTKRGFTVQQLVDKKATKAGILKAMRTMIDNAKKGDSIIIQYSGHGSYVPDLDGDEPDDRDECLCPYDVDTKGAITDDQLYELYSSKETGVQLVIFSDSCHSGTVARFARNSIPPALAGNEAPMRKVRFLPPATFLPAKQLNQMGVTRAIRSSSPPGRYGGLLISGCQDYEYSYDANFNGRPNGAFTFVALNTLKKLSAKATYNDWYKAIKKALPTQEYPQSPNLFGSSAMKKWKIFS